MSIPKVIFSNVLVILFPHVCKNNQISTDQKVKIMWQLTLERANGFCHVATPHEFNLEKLSPANKKLYEKAKNTYLLWTTILKDQTMAGLKQSREKYESSAEYREIHQSGDFFLIVKNLNSWMLQQKDLKQVTYLNLSRKGRLPLTEIPIAIGALKNLSYLIISYDLRNSLLEKIEKLENLKTIEYENEPDLQFKFEEIAPDDEEIPMPPLLIRR